ncbi:hypothetical protein CI109_104975 [Kwoniella shandongensis]|uniref:SGNH hydrolase-type esterase domain-containing protein n=1 Tax=Kwoniella shandongensis TaxID=1734106 RepID=A0AAJ8LPJ3_9TREE
MAYNNEYIPPSSINKLELSPTPSSGADQLPSSASLAPSISLGPEHSAPHSISNRRRYPNPISPSPSPLPDTPERSANTHHHPLSTSSANGVGIGNGIGSDTFTSSRTAWLRSLLPSNIMRVSRNNAKLYLNLSIALNLIVLIVLFLPSERAHGLIGDSAWAKVQEYDWLRRPGGAGGPLAGQAVLENRRVGCSMCEVDPALCEDMGEFNLRKAVGYSGSNNRLRRVLAKMKRGEPFTVGVIGGSVSKGHGLDAADGDNPHTPKNLNRIVFDHLDSLFPSSKGIVTGKSGKAEGKNSFINGAQGGMGTDYFSLCFNEHIPEDVDLVLIELSINDEVLIRNMNTYELLIRGLLDLPNKPAVMNLQVFALMFQYIANGGDLHNGVAQFYDIPTLSIRNPILPQVMQNTTMVRHLFHNRVKKMEWTDPLDEIDLRHLSWQGHELMGKIGSAYIDAQLCEMERIESRLDAAELEDIDSIYPIEDLPLLPLMAKFNPANIMPTLKPQCYSANAVQHPLKPTEQQGWKHWNWKEKHYLIANEPGSKVSFKISTTLGSVQLHYLRSYQYNLGSAKCWIDDDTGKAMRLDGYWKEPYNIGRAATIRDDLKPGDHMLHCELLKETADPTGGKEFRIISVMR